MLLSRATEYGIQALVHLREEGRDEPISISRIAEERGISPTFLAKVVNSLVVHGLLLSQKGAGGGVRLAKPANKIQLLEVVQAIDGLSVFSRCVIGYPDCGDARPCPVHATWGPLREEMEAMLSSKSLDDMICENDAKHPWIAKTK